MTIQPIGAASVVLFLTPSDLRERGLSPDCLTAARTLELAREAFRQSGLCAQGPMEIETYPERCGMLIFVHLRPAQATAWRFEDCECLLCAALALREGGPDGALYWWEGRFWLVLPGEAYHTCASLSEFSDQETGDPYIFARLEEYGAPLLPSGALARLRRYFG